MASILSEIFVAPYAFVLLVHGEVFYIKMT